VDDLTGRCRHFSSAGAKEELALAGHRLSLEPGTQYLWCDGGHTRAN
jgi:hypothetical protein